MAIVSYDRLTDIISYIPKEITRCGDIEEFVRASLSKSWDQHTMKMKSYHEDLGLSCDDVYDPHWNLYEYREEYICLNIIDEIDNYLNKYGYLAVALELYNDNDHFAMLNHAFVVCNTEQGQVICDSYINTHPVEIRPFNLHETLTSLITTPTINNWNRIWQSKHKDISNNNLEFFIEMSYYDMNGNKEEYFNGVKVY